MARSKMKKARPFEKLMELMLDGNQISKDEIAKKLGWGAPRGSKTKGPKIYNISSYIWDIKNLPQVDGRSIVIRSIRNGKKVTAYQIVNIDDARTYLEGRGLLEKKSTTIETVPVEIGTSAILTILPAPVKTPLIDSYFKEQQQDSKKVNNKRKSKKEAV